MTISVSPSESDTLKSLRTFLLSVLPLGTPVVEGQVNRVPETGADDFVVMTEVRRTRLETNIDKFVDARFTASISGPVMTVTEVDYGALKVGSVVFGVGLTNPTTVTALGTGHGGTGTYTVSPGQTVLSEVMAAGVLDALQPIDFTIQLDVHGPSSADNAHIASTMLRDEYAVNAFASYGRDVVPLYAEDPLQVPFVNDQNQYENRWVVQSHLQVNATVDDIPQQFFESVVVGLIDVDAKYPP